MTLDPARTHVLGAVFPFGEVICSEDCWCKTQPCEGCGAPATDIYVLIHYRDYSAVRGNQPEAVCSKCLENSHPSPEDTERGCYIVFEHYEPVSRSRGEEE
jgi:hypothetical protein